MATCPAMWAAIAWAACTERTFYSSPVTPLSTDGPSLPTSFCYNADFRGKGCPLGRESQSGVGKTSMRPEEVSLTKPTAGCQAENRE